MTEGWGDTALRHMAWVVGIFAGIVAALNGLDTWRTNHAKKKSTKKKS